MTPNTTAVQLKLPRVTIQKTHKTDNNLQVELACENQVQWQLYAGDYYKEVTVKRGLTVYSEQLGENCIVNEIASYLAWVMEKEQTHDINIVTYWHQMGINIISVLSQKNIHTSLGVGN